MKDKCFIFVLLLFIRISLICSEDLFWFTCISRDFDTNAKAKLQKGKHIHKNWIWAPSVCPMGFLFYAGLHSFSHAPISFYSHFTMQQMLSRWIYVCNTSHTSTYKTHTCTHKQNHLHHLIESMILTNNFICSHWQYFLIYTTFPLSIFDSQNPHTHSYIFRQHLEAALIPNARLRMMKTN